MLLIHNERKIKNLSKQFLDEIKYIKYWDRVEKFFIKKKKNNAEKFIGSFKHGSYYDDEFKIETLAKKYGYGITDEKLYSNKSVYIFKKMIWIEYEKNYINL